MGQSPSRDGAAIADGALVIEMRKVQSAYGWAGKWNVPALLAEQVGEAGCRAIAPKLRPGRFRKGQGVFKQGDTCELIFVNRGSISVDDRTLIPGDYYGAVGVLLSEARMTEARAEEDAEVLFLSGADIFELVNSGHFELSHSLLFADAGNLGGSERLQRARGVARLLTGGDVHPGAIHEKRPRTPATQTEDGRRRIVAWEASFVAEADDDERLRLARTLPVGSALRGLMKTLRKAEVTVSDPVSVATQYSRVPVKTARALLKAPWLRETPKYAVAEVLTRSRMRSYPRGARVLEPRGEIAHVFLVSRGTLRATLAHRRGAESRVLKRKDFFGRAGFGPPPGGLSLMEVEALEDCELLQLAAEDLLEVLNLFPVMWDSTERLRHLFRILPRKGSIPDAGSASESQASSDTETSGESSHEA